MAEPCHGLPFSTVFVPRVPVHENGRNRFLLTAPPLNLPGAVGSPANAIATV